MSSKNADLSYIARIGAVPLTAAKVAKADELARLKNKALRAEGGEPDFTSSALAIIQGVPEYFTPQEVPALAFRLQAGAALVASGVLKGLATKDPNEPGGWIVDEAVLEAIATAPLQIESDQPAFDLERFREIALKAAEPDGRA